MRGLFEQWLNIAKNKTSQKNAIDQLNAICGTRYTDSWPSKMQSRGFSLERTPTKVRRYMMSVVLPELVPGKTQEEYERLITSLT